MNISMRYWTPLWFCVALNSVYFVRSPLACLVYRLCIDLFKPFRFGWYSLIRCTNSECLLVSFKIRFVSIFGRLFLIRLRIAWFSTVILTSSFFLCSPCKVLRGLIDCERGLSLWCIMLVIFSNRIRFSLSISVYFSSKSWFFLFEYGIESWYDWGFKLSTFYIFSIDTLCSCKLDSSIMNFSPLLFVEVVTDFISLN